MNYRVRVAKKQLKYLSLIPVAIRGGYETYNTARDIKDAWESYKRGESVADYGKRKLKEDFGIDVDKLNKTSVLKELQKNGTVKVNPQKYNISSNKMVYRRATFPIKNIKTKSTTKSKRKAKSTAPVKGKIGKEIRQIKKQLKSDQAYHTFKTSNVDYVNASEGTCSHIMIGGYSNTQLETACSYLRYYDPSVPGTLVTAAGGTGTYNRDIHFNSVHGSINVRNNYQIPARVKIYVLSVKSDTHIEPLTYYSDGVTDQVVTGGSVNAPDLYLTDIDLLTEQWKVKCLKSKLLQPGQELTAYHVAKSFDYNPAMVDSHNVQYQKKYKAFRFIVRVEGALGHDTVQNEQGLLQSSVDVQFTMVYKITYDAGVNLNDISIVDNRNTFTTAGVVSNKPVSDNQQYSVT